MFLALLAAVSPVALPLATSSLAFLGCLEQHINALESSGKTAKIMLELYFSFLF